MAQGAAIGLRGDSIGVANERANKVPLVPWNVCRRRLHQRLGRRLVKVHRLVLRGYELDVEVGEAAEVEVVGKRRFDVANDGVLYKP